MSYYDYFQPEAYVPSSDTYIEKDSSINDHIEQMRLSATKALLSRRDSLIVATVSAIYGLGDPDQYLKMRMHLMRGEHTDQRELIRHLTELQYTRGDYELKRGSYRVRGDVIDVFPAESEVEALRIELFDGDIENPLDLRSADRCGAAQGAAVHDLSEDALRDDARKRAARGGDDQGRVA